MESMCWQLTNIDIGGEKKKKTLSLRSFMVETSDTCFSVTLEMVSFHTVKFTVYSLAKLNVIVDVSALARLTHHWGLPYSGLQLAFG